MADQPTTTSERNEIQIAVMTEKVTNIEKTTTRIDSTLHDLTTQFGSTYVTKSEFSPVKSVVYGLVALILTAVVGAMIYLVIQRP
jgi:hypothetical protein